MNKARILQWSLKTPKAYPRKKPIGCARCLVTPKEELVTEWAMKDTEEGREEGLEEAWGNVVGAMEWELCGVNDRFGGNWPDERYMGRGRGPAYGWKQILPPRIAGKFGEADPYMHALLWARNRLTELLHLARALGGRRGEGDTVTERRERQCPSLCRKTLVEP